MTASKHLFDVQTQFLCFHDSCFQIRHSYSSYTSHSSYV